jgi:hypothetical protein
MSLANKIKITSSDIDRYKRFRAAKGDPKIINKCARKIKYLTQEDALVSIKQLKKKSDYTSKGQLGAYLCDCCNGYHVGTKKVKYYEYKH